MKNLFRINRENLTDFLNIVNNKNNIEKQNDKNLNSIEKQNDKKLNVIESEDKNLNVIESEDKNKILWQIGKSKIKIDSNIKKNLSKNLLILIEINKLFTNFINSYPNLSLKEIINQNVNESNMLFSNSDGNISLHDKIFQINLKNTNNEVYNILDCGTSKITNINFDDNLLYQNNVPLFENIISNPKNINNIYKLINTINSDIPYPFNIDNDFLNGINLTNIILPNKKDISETQSTKNNIYKSTDKYIFYIKSYISYANIFFINLTDNNNIKSHEIPKQHKNLKI